MRGVLRRAGWGFFDQALSSGTNFALGVVVAASVGAAEFGVFTLAYATYGLFLGVSEGFASTPLTVRFSAETGPHLHAAEKDSVGSALTIGLVAGVGCILVSPFLGSKLGPALRSLGIVFPGLLVQDAWRFAFVARARPVLAALNDALWAVLQFGGIALLIATHRESATAMVLVWGGAATVAAVVGCVQGGAWPSPARWRSWLGQQRDLGPRYAVETVAHRSGPYALLFAVGLFAGVKVVAAVRGGMLLVAGPLNLLMVGAGFVVLPEGVRLYRQSPSRLPRAATQFALGMAALASVWCLIVLGTSARLGPKLLGATWPYAKPLVPALSVFIVVQAVAVGPGLGLWVLTAASRSLRVQLCGLVLAGAAMNAGASLDGARGVAIGLTAATVVTAVLWWHQFLRAFTTAEPTASSQGTRDEARHPEASRLPVIDA